MGLDQAGGPWISQWEKSKKIIFLKGIKGRKTEFTERETRVTNKFIERLSTSLVIREMQMKTRRHYVTPRRYTKMTAMDNVKC